MEVIAVSILVTQLHRSHLPPLLTFVPIHTVINIHYDSIV